MEQSLPQKTNLDLSNLFKRVVSAVVGIPVVIGAIYLGSPFLEIATVFLLGVLLWEWSNMSGLPLSHPINAVVSLLMGLSLIGAPSFTPAFIFVSSCFLFVVYYQYKLGSKLFTSVYLLSGPLYVGLGIISLLKLGRLSPLLLVWILAIVWTTDTGAYLTGSILKGPKLIPRISPGKTWSGLIGGSLFGTSMGILLASYCGIPFESVNLLMFCLFITFVGHFGDIIESAVKRHYKVKDSSHIIPGHGGLLDRIDSLLLVSLFMVMLIYFRVL